MLMDNDTEHALNASACGDNCAAWILRIAREKEGQGEDLAIDLRHMLDFGREPFGARVMNRDAVATCMHDLLILAGEYV